MLKISGKIRCKVNFTPFVPPPPRVTPNSHLCAYCIEFTFPHLPENKPPTNHPILWTPTHLTPCPSCKAKAHPHDLRSERRTSPTASNSVSSGLPNGSTGRSTDGPRPWSGLPPPEPSPFDLAALMQLRHRPGAGAVLNLITASKHTGRPTKRHCPPR